MFGESDSESPRVPSPWDSLTPSSSPKQDAIPRLAPEAEEGNVEYKLQLLSPTPARFARLVTQLKWRLLEGGGQAYYELGVADSGTLVGLPRQQLEESLETLEMMAGEIGASVIVVKEIEVPQELSSIAESQLERWDGRKRAGRKDVLRMMKQQGASPITFATESETESSIDVTDTEECSGTYSSPASFEEETHLAQLGSSTNPFPFDPALAVFTMDMGEDGAKYADEGPVDDAPTGSVTKLAVSSVYKPRPMRKRTPQTAPSLPIHFVYTRDQTKNGYLPLKSTDATHHGGDSAAEDPIEIRPNGGTSPFRRDKRDGRRELKPNTLLTHVPIRHLDESPIDPAAHHTVASSPADPPYPSAPESHVAVVDPEVSTATTIVSKEPRLIVEVLVVRKLSLDEAFLDFESFSLQ